jgi:diguanylate cyclase (GGDEF)-like protein
MAMGAPKDRFKVLVADDSVIYRKLVEQTLSPDDWAILFAKTGQEAIDLFQLHQPALLITDWVMPDFTGVEICQRIRVDFNGAYTYIILLTSMSEKAHVVEGLAAGADDYLTKPFHPEELLARLGVGRRIVELHRQIEAKNRLLEELALTDALTGLPNRRAIVEWAGRQLNGAARHGFPFWVAMADLDNFKTVNDTYGHDAGDEVLKKFGELLKFHSRRSDICGRIGGEEFLFVLTHADEENVRLVVDRVRKQFQEQTFTAGSKKFSATASFGIAGFVGGAPPEFSKLVSEADAALYSAKRNGRNRVEFAMSSTSDPELQTAK